MIKTPSNFSFLWQHSPSQNFTQSLRCTHCDESTNINEAYTTIDATKRNSKKIYFCSIECCIEHDVLKGLRWDVEDAFETCYKKWLQNILKINDDQDIKDYKEKLSDVYYTTHNDWMIENQKNKKKNK